MELFGKMGYRINKEILFLVSKFKTVNVEYDFEKMNHIHITIHRKNKIQSMIIEFYITDGYPFTPPIVHINKKPYNDFVKCKSSRLMHMVYCKEGFCPCCHSIVLKKDQWLPIYFLEKIIDEIDKISAIKHKMKYYLALKNISEKINLPVDLETHIIEYLLA